MLKAYKDRYKTYKKLKRNKVKLMNLDKKLKTLKINRWPKSGKSRKAKILIYLKKINLKII